LQADAASSQASRATKAVGPPLLSFVLGCLVVNLPAAVALAVASGGAGFGAWLGAFVLGMALGVVWFKVDRAMANLIATFFASFVVPIPVVAFVATALPVVFGQVETMSLDEAPNAEASMIAIRDAVVDSKLVGEDLSEANPGQMPTSYFAAPVVERSWSAEAPIAVWLQCAGEGDDPRASCEDAWARRPIVGKVQRAPPRESPSIANAMKKHGLVAPKEVLILRTSASPRVDAWATIIGVGMLLLLLNVLVLWLLLWRRKAAARARAT
jgi:hypothetical protein